MGRGWNLTVTGKEGFTRVSICVKRRARQLPGDKHLSQENNTCEGAGVTVCLACVRAAESQCGWNRVSKVDHDGNGRRGIREVRG